VERKPKDSSKAPPAEGRQKQSDDWGPFKVALVRRGGENIGYGGTCKKHLNPTDGPTTECKKQLAAARCGGDYDLCRRAIKAWLYLGQYVKVGDCSRSDHMDIDPLDAVQGYSEEELDELIAL
jgi:hypothetical protein